MRLLSDPAHMTVNRHRFPQVEPEESEKTREMIKKMKSPLRAKNTLPEGYRPAKPVKQALEVNDQSLSFTHKLNEESAAKEGTAEFNKASEIEN